MGRLARIQTPVQFSKNLHEHTIKEVYLFVSVVRIVTSFLSCKHNLKKSGRAWRNIGKYTIVHPNRTVSFSKYSFFKLLHLLIRSYKVPVLLICSRWPFLTFLSFKFNLNLHSPVRLERILWIKLTVPITVLYVLFCSFDCWFLPASWHFLILINRAHLCFDAYYFNDVSQLSFKKVSFACLGKINVTTLECSLHVTWWEARVPAYRVEADL